MLKIQFKDKRQAPFWVMEKSFSIGLSEKNHLAIDDPSLSPVHAKIMSQDDSFTLKDQGSRHGTYVNGQRVTQKHIICGDIIRLGNVELEIIDPLVEYDGNYWSLIADSSWLSGQEFPILGNTDDVISLGRSPKCDIVFPGTHLSRLHAEIRINHSSLTIQDMGSANGTFINDKKINSATIHAGDQVRLDVYSFRVFGPGITLPTSATTAIHDVPDIDQLEQNQMQQEKRWKSKPTSPGNREEINLYQKHYRQYVLVGMVIMALLGTVTYVALGVTGLLN